MPTQTADAPSPVQEELTWELARLFPAQGKWSEWEYFALETNHRVEFSHGRVEVPSFLTTTHQFILGECYQQLHEFAVEHRPDALTISGICLRLWPGKIRQPDIAFLLGEHRFHCGEQFWTGADLVMEVVSGGARDRERDLIEKRQEYAQAGIPEYWIVDPETETVIVLVLDGDEYAEHGLFQRGETATSRLLPGFAVAVDKVLTAGRG